MHVQKGQKFMGGFFPEDRSQRSQDTGRLSAEQNTMELGAFSKFKSPV